MRLAGFAILIIWRAVSDDDKIGITITLFHYNDVIIGAMASQITSLTIVSSTVYSGTDLMNENIKAPRHWPLWGELTGDRWIPHTKSQ